MTTNFMYQTSKGDAVPSKSVQTPRFTSFADLVECVRTCTACTEMHHVHVLSSRNGPVPAPVMFIGEAVGRLGGARTGVPMTNDATGRRFQRLLDCAGIARERIFITNAVLCNPLRDGRNRRPTRQEVSTCAPFLRDQIALIDPRIVVTLGEVALSALGVIEKHGLTLRESVGQATEWNGRTLVPLYHTGPRAVLHRSAETQITDWTRLGTVLIDRYPDLEQPSVT